MSWCIVSHQFLLLLLNCVFMCCGITILTGGFFLFMDNKRMLLSQLVLAATAEDSEHPLYNLPQPFFYYIALALTTGGFVILSISVLGCWSAILNTKSLLGLYFVLILLLLLVELGICLVVVIWPQCLGFHLNVGLMVRALQGRYGVPGQEKFTVAIDWAQVAFECCAINTSINYDTSLWKLQNFGQSELAVPLTCCHLMNKFEPDSYLDPHPINISQCQSLEESEYEKSRQYEGCLDKIENWYREHYVIFLGAGLVMAILEFLLLLIVILNCTKIKHRRMKQQMSTIKRLNNQKEIVTTNNLNTTNNISNLSENIYHESNVNGMPDIRDVFVQPQDLNQHRFPPTKFKANYRLANSYLV